LRSSSAIAGYSHLIGDPALHVTTHVFHTTGGNQRVPNRIERLALNLLSAYSPVIPAGSAMAAFV
jgi:hypothetical protein